MWGLGQLESFLVTLKAHHLSDGLAQRTRPSSGLQGFCSFMHCRYPAQCPHFPSCSSPPQQLLWAPQIQPVLQTSLPSPVNFHFCTSSPIKGTSSPPFFFFNVDHFLKFLLSLLQYFCTICYKMFLIYVLVFWPWGMWDLSYPTRDGTCTPSCRSLES